MTMEPIKEMPPKTARKSATKAPAPAPSTDGSKAASLLRSMMAKLGIKPVETAASTMPHVPSGSIIINDLIGGSRALDGKGSVCPGYPRRKITEIYGSESSGKTTIALAAAAGVQREGGSVLYLDFEHALHHGYAKQIGVKFNDTFTLVAPETMEQGFKLMWMAIAAGTDLVIVDSVAAMVPELELEKKIDEVAKVGAVAKKMSETLPKFALWLMKYPVDGTGENARSRKDAPGTALILLNQERATINTSGGHGQPEPNTSGGKALKYYAYVRLRLSRKSSEMIERKDPSTGKKKKYPYGNVTIIKMVKSKADAKQGHSAEIFIRFGYGVDDAYSVIESGVGVGVIKREGAYYSYGTTRIQGRDKFRQYLLSDAAVFTVVKTAVSEALIACAPSAIADEDISEDDALLADANDTFGGSFSGPDDSETPDTAEPAPEETTVVADDDEEG